MYTAHNKWHLAKKLPEFHSDKSLSSTLISDIKVDDEIQRKESNEDILQLNSILSGEVLIEEDDDSLSNLNELNLSDYYSEEIVIDDDEDSMVSSLEPLDFSASLSGEIIIEEKISKNEMVFSKMDLTNEMSGEIIIDEEDEATIDINTRQSIKPINQNNTKQDTHFQSTSVAMQKMATMQFEVSVDTSPKKNKINTSPKVDLMAMAEAGVKAFASVKDRVDVMGNLAQQMAKHMALCNGSDGGHKSYNKISAAQVEQAQEQAMVNIMNTKFGEKLAKKEILTAEEEQQIAQIISQTLDGKLGTNTRAVIEKFDKYDVSLSDPTKLALLIPNLMPQHTHGSGCGHEGSSMKSTFTTNKTGSKTTNFASIGQPHDHEHARSYAHNHDKETTCEKHKKIHIHKGKKCPECIKEREEQVKRGLEKRNKASYEELWGWLFRTNQNKKKGVKKSNSNSSLYLR